MDFVPKTNWADEPSTTTPITAAELVRMENGIAEGARDATEALRGNVELASSAEMTTGTDLTRVPSVKRVADYVATAISGLGGGSTPPASETVVGSVELATSGEMTTGTDTLRVPPVARVASYVTSAINTAVGTINTALAGKADKTGSISQFADVSSTAPADQDLLGYSNETNAWDPTDLSGQYAGLGPDNRLATVAEPRFYIPQLVLNEGALIPSDTPVGAIILRRSVTASITPVYLGEDTSQNSTTLTVAVSQTILVGDYLLISFFGSGETGAPVTFSLSVAGGGVFGTLDSATTRLQTSTVQCGILFARCTTQVNSGSVVTVTVNSARSGMGCTMAKASALLSTGVRDADGGIGYASSATISCPTSSSTGQAQELGLFTVAFNPGDNDERVVSGTNGWAPIGPAVHSSWGASPQDRAGIFFFKELSATGFITGTASINEGGIGSTVSSANILTLKAA